MKNLVMISLFLIKNMFGTTMSYSKDFSYVNTQLDRHNTLDKGVWMKNQDKENILRQSNVGEFIFGLNPEDTDNNYSSFNDVVEQNGPSISNYIERPRRSTDDESNVQDSEKDCDTKDCIKAKKSVKSKLITTLKPASVLNEYPFEIALLLNDNQFGDFLAIDRKPKFSIKTLNVTNDRNHANPKATVNAESKVENVIVKNDTEKTGKPKVIKKNSYESELIKKLEFTEEIHKDIARSHTNKKDRNVFDKGEMVWYQNAPALNKNIKNAKIKNKFINERALIKILATLTKTFKKIMKQHSDIKQIHTNLHHLNDEVSNKILDITNKFEDIVKKHAYIVAVGEKVKQLEAKFDAKDEHYNTKNKEFTNKLLEFENQQKKFLTQQRQFYNIQRLMLAQNEKINLKQTLIAKTQSNIFHRQKNFASILNKAKDVLMNNRKSTLGKLTFSTTPPNAITNTKEGTNITFISTQAPITTESIKIDLFSISTSDKLVNQDSFILQEKDRKTVDDLVYKYYFNNTLIDNIMKTKIFPAFNNNPETPDLVENTKSKRDDEVKTTMLFPVSQINRPKRWIRKNKAKSKRQSRDKLEESHFDDGRPANPKSHTGNKNKIGKAARILNLKKEHSPFLVMARNFCNEIKQNANDQVLSWCVEKALRRLENIDLKIIPISETSTKGILDSTPLNRTRDSTVAGRNNTNETSKADTKITAPPTDTTSTTVISQTVPSATIYFPDNDELELNLKQYELKPDTEGTVYYDGSLHASDIVSTRESEGYSDIMPGMDSNSRQDMDPMTLSLQALKRYHARRIAERKRPSYG